MKNVGMIDGKIVQVDQNVVKLEDRGYQFGDGVYDAWCFFNGRHMLLNEHLDRLERSCSYINIKPSFSREELVEIIDRMVRDYGSSEGFIYIQYTRGWMSPRSHVNKPDTKSILSGLISPIKPFPDEYFTKGVKNITFPDNRHLYCHVKSLNLLGSVLARNAAAEKGCYEAILIREQKDGPVVTECSLSNCFAVKDGVLYTSPLGNLILPGITRAAVINLAKKDGIKVVEEFKTPEFFFNADKVFITNSVAAALPVYQIDDKAVGQGVIGPVGKRIMELYQNLINQVCYE